MSKTEILLMLKVIENLSTYTSDDHYAEMLSDEENAGNLTFDQDVEALETKLKGML